MHGRWNQWVITGATALLAGIAGFAYGNAFDRIVEFEKWQTFLGTGVALVVGLFAWANVREKLTIDLMSREEDRIERLAPGMEQAIAYLGSYLNGYAGSRMLPQVHKRLESASLFHFTFAEMHKALEQKLYLTDPVTRHRIAQVLVAVARAAKEYSDTRLRESALIGEMRREGNLIATKAEVFTILDEKLKPWADKYFGALRSVKDLLLELKERHDLWTKMRPHLRSRIESHFQSLMDR